jgi:hypothetical protein
MTNKVGRALTMGYLGNFVAIGPRYSDFDVILAHGDSLLLPLRRKPVVRIMHGNALEEARSATSIGRAVLQSGVYVLELLTGFLQRGAVAVSANTVRFNPFIRRVIANGIDLRIFRPDRTARSRVPSILFVGALKGRKRGAWLLDLFERDIRPAFPDAELHMVTTPGPRRGGVTYHTGVEARTLVRLYQHAGTPRLRPTRASACRTRKRWRAEHRSLQRPIPVVGKCSRVAGSACWRATKNLVPGCVVCSPTPELRTTGSVASDAGVRYDMARAADNTSRS